MVLYVDETENDSMFLVAGLLVDSEETVRKAYGRFKKSLKGFHLSPKAKVKLFTEFKSTILDTRNQRIKIRMLKMIREMSPRIIYGCYLKENESFDQAKKERVYISFLSEILKRLYRPSVVFDGFGKPNFEKKIIQTVTDAKLVEKAVAGDSQCVEGLQFADNICSVLRLHKAGKDIEGFYEIIEDISYEI